MLLPYTNHCRGANRTSNWVELWKIGKADSSFWYDNWTSCGAWYHILEAEEVEVEVEVCHFTDSQGWNQQKLRNGLPEDYVLHIMKNIPPPKQKVLLDEPVRMLEHNGKFSVKSA